MFDWLVGAGLDFVRQYGFLAVFVYMTLETSFLLHFVPSEVVVPFAAGLLVHDPASFALFVLDATAGATAGSLLAYVLFGHYGRELLARYGHLLHVSEGGLDRSQDLFVAYGESTVFWGRMVPFLRALISVPAGIAEMDLRRFVLYSTAGAALFNTGLTYLVYTGANTTSPLGLAFAAVRRWLSDPIAYVQTHTALVVVAVGSVALLVAALWSARGWIRANPGLAKGLALHLLRALGVLAGTLVVIGALSSPHRAFASITWAWDDPLFFLTLGLSERITLLLLGGVAILIGLAAFEVGRLVRIAHVRALATAVRDRL